MVDQKMSDEQVSIIREAFAYYDSEGVGSHKAKDLVKILRSLGISLSENDIREKILADDENRLLDFDGVVSLVSSFIEGKTKESEDKAVRDAFEIITKSQDSVPLSTLRNLLSTVGNKMSEKECIAIHSKTWYLPWTYLHRIQQA
eukprot:966188_1